MNILLQLLAGLLYTATLFSAWGILHGLFPLLFGKEPKGFLFGGWLLNLLILVISVLGLFALGFPGV